MAAYYRATFADFVAADPDTVLGVLNRASGDDIFSTQFTKQIKAWQHEIASLKAVCMHLISKYPSGLDYSVLLEYRIPRRQKRIDAVLLAGGIIICIEFKTEDRVHTRHAQRQVEEYALDLRDFHEQSAGRVIVPVLVSARAPSEPNKNQVTSDDAVRNVRLANRGDLADVIAEVLSAESEIETPPIDAGIWDVSPYRPIPTIIEAAESLYANHDVREIAHSHAGATNLTRTSECLISVIRDAQRERRKVICVVTGVPGAGKTLAGLNVVHNAALRGENGRPGVFLSGNGPLVKIVAAAISKQHRQLRTGVRSTRVASTFIQSVHSFARFAIENPDIPPAENVIVFDEAQRAWNKAQNEKKTGRAKSEPTTMLSIMDRHSDWAVLVALVGGGQEINTGEAGLAEWGRSLESDFRHWHVVVSPQALNGDASVSGHKLFESGETEFPSIQIEPSLHLDIPLRSFRALQLTKWVEAVLGGDASTAREIAQGMKSFPMRLTRSLETARKWLRNKTRGLRRCGLVASAGGLRLRAEGIELSSGFRTGNRGIYESWFLAEPDDVRSSNQLEIAASEFECQGLELDWVGVCWSGDFTFDPSNNGWIYLNFSGPRWKKVQSVEDRRYLLNTYRVLLTRARQGLIVWIPNGSDHDDTRAPEPLDRTADHLLRCGLKML